MVPSCELDEAISRCPSPLNSPITTDCGLGPVSRVVGETTVRGRPCVIIETSNHDRALPYARLLSTLDRGNALPVRTEYYDERGRLTRAGTIDQIIDINGRPTPLKFTMINEAEGGQSVLRLSDIRYDVGLAADLFTLERLESGSDD